jgi:hypothetical protein
VVKTKNNFYRNFQEQHDHQHPWPNHLRSQQSYETLFISFMDKKKKKNAKVGFKRHHEGRFQQEERRELCPYLDAAGK